MFVGSMRPFECAAAHSGGFWLFAGLDLAASLFISVHLVLYPCATSHLVQDLTGFNFLESFNVYLIYPTN